MTAIAQRRTRRTYVAAALAGTLAVLAATMFVVGTITLSNSREGEAVGIDDRPHEKFPSTPNAALAVTDDDGRLTSVVVLTLLPTGQGGSIVTIPVNADSTAGFGLERRPLREDFDADDPSSIVTPLENLLSVSIQRSLVVDPAGLVELLGPIQSVPVELPSEVIDSDLEAQVVDAVDDVEPAEENAADDGAAGDDSAAEEVVEGLVQPAGEHTLDAEELVAVLTAVDDEVPEYTQHELDVAVWRALAGALSGSGSNSASEPLNSVVPRAESTSGAPADVAELLDALWQGEVGVRDVSLATLAGTENPTEADVVLLDRRDSSLIFAQVSPGLVSTPGGGLNVRVVAGFDADQLAQSDGLFETTTDLLHVFIGQMLAVENAVVSADPSPAGAPEVTLVEVSSEQFLDDTELAAEALFGEAEVRLAETVLDGVDIQVTLGMTYIERELILRELIRAEVEANGDGSEASTPPNSSDASTSVPGDVAAGGDD